MAVSAEHVLYLAAGIFGAAPTRTLTYDLMTRKDTVALANELGVSQYAKDVFGVSNQAKAEKLAENLLGSAVTADVKTAAIGALKGMLDANGGNVGAAGYEAIVFLSKKTDASYADAWTQLQNRVAVAQAYVDSANPATTFPLTSVTKDTATKDAVISAIKSGADTAPLTVNTDNLVANKFSAGLDYTPGGTDRVNTLQDEDVLTGTGVNPTLNATLGNANDNGGTIITPKLQGVETINLSFTGSNAAGGNGAVVALDLQDATNVKAVNIDRVTQVTNTARVENAKQVLETMGIAKTNANNAGVIEFSFGNGVLAGESTGKLNLSDVQVGTVNIGQNSSGVNAAGVNGGSYENLTINSAGVANSIGTLALPMDTGSAGKVTITGDKNLQLGTSTNVVNAVTGTVESQTWSNGITQANGRLATIDASGMTDGALTLNIAAGLLTTGKADTSGVDQNVSIIGSKNADTFILQDTIQAGDSINGGDGADKIIITNGGNINSTSSVVGKVEAVEVRLNATGTATVDFDKLPDVTGVLVRNEGQAAAAPAAATATYNLNNLTAAQAGAITVQHSNTGSNAVGQNLINVNLKSAAGTTDSVTLTIAEGLNTDPRFNATLSTQAGTGFTGGVENVTLVDADSESNTIALASVAQHTGTVTVGTTAGAGKAGTFLNLDTTTAGANGGLYQYAVNGADDLASSNAGATVGRIADHSLTAGQVKIVAATVNAAAETSNVIVRVSTNAASVVGAQNITMGAGNDTVIFDNVNDTRAGLTISDTVAGGAGNDTLAIDGNGVAVSLGASEWTNVSGFETLRVIGNGAAVNNAAGATNSYNLTLTNSLLANNKDTNGFLNIVSDNDLFNNTGRTAAEAAAANVGGVAVPNDAALTSGGVTIDARSLSAGSKWSYKGNEGAGASADRLILSDANIDGNAVIDGGAIDNITNNRGMNTTAGNGTIANKGNTDVLEVRNAAVVSQGDLANVKNIGTLSFTNDMAVTQVSTLQLNDAIVDNMVDSFQASTSRTTTTSATNGANVEVLQINAVDNINVAAATTGLTIEAGSLTDKSELDITLGRGANNVTTGAGNDRVVLLGNYAAGTYNQTENGVSINAQATAVAGGATPARVVTDTIALGTGTDTLVTYGAINLAGATLTGVENVIANSTVVMTAAQFRALTSLTFEGNTTHQLRIIGDGGAALDLSKISLGSTNGANGSLTIDTRASVNGVDGAATATVNAVVDRSTTGDSVTGNVATNANNNATLTTAVVNLVAGQTFTGTTSVNDVFTGTIAALNATTITGTAADTETLRLTDAGTVNINNGTTGGIVINMDKLELANGVNTISFTGTSGIKDILGGTGNDSITVTNITTGGSIALGAGDDALTAMTVAIATATNASFAGGDGTDSVTFADGETITAASLSAFNSIESVVFGAIGATSAVTLVNGITSINANLATDGRNLTVTGTGAQLSALTSITNGDNDGNSTFNLTVSDTGATVDLVGDTLSSDVDVITFSTGTNTLKIDATNIAKIAGNVVAAGSTDVLELSNTATVANTKFNAFETIQAAAGSTAIDITDSGVGVARTIIGNAGANTITVGNTTAAKTVNITSGGADIVAFDTSNATTGTTTVTGFQVGALASGGDKIDLGGTIVAQTGIVTTGAAAAQAAAGSFTDLLVLSSANYQVSGALTQTGNAGEVEAKIIAAAITLAAQTAGQGFYAVLDNGTDTGIYQVTLAGTAGTAGVIDNVADFSVVLVGVLSGVADAGTLTAANFG